MIWGPNSLERTQEVLQMRLQEQASATRRVFELMIEEKATAQVVGGAGLRVAEGALEADLGYVLARAKWGQGIVPEACAKLMEVAFGWLGLHRVWASTDAQNKASQRVLEKLGMRREAHFMQNEWIKERYRDTLVYALTEAEYWAT
jgi:RimJ/RimL family protein N-acetyltransferase